MKWFKRLAWMALGAALWDFIDRLRYRIEMQGEEP